MALSTCEWVYVCGLCAGSVVRVVYVFGPGRSGRRARGGWWADRVLLGLAGLALIPLPLLSLATPWLDGADYRAGGWTCWAGGAAFAGAIGLLWASHAALGACWTPRPDPGELERGLVTTGIYGRMRHPMYAAHLLWGVAQALLVHNWVAGPSFLVAFAAFCAVRIPKEERALRAAFGAQYEAYRARTGRLVPRRGSQRPAAP
jgi:protein-S-isoprenylcysteine O-methyltransferase Ste14